MREIATSTVAMTAYNALAGCPGGRTIDEIADMVSAWAMRSRLVIPEAQIVEAVSELLKRKFIRAIGPLLDVTDPMRRLVVQRDRSDEGQDGAGWRGWKVYARPMAAPAMVQLEDLI